MSKFNSLPDRALDLVSKVGENFHQLVPSAGKWLETGAKLGALKGGARVAGLFVRRNPAIAIATAAGAGLLWYAAHRKARRAENGTLEGSSTRVEARRANGSTTRKKPAARKRSARKTTGSSSE